MLFSIIPISQIDVSLRTATAKRRTKKDQTKIVLQTLKKNFGGERKVCRHKY
jgi:hypothetical protein